MKNKTERDDHILFAGTVAETQRDKFNVVLDGTDTIVIATLSGKLRLNKIRILPGDRVTLAVSKYDTSRGIIKSRN